MPREKNLVDILRVNFCARKIKSCWDALAVNVGRVYFLSDFVEKPKTNPAKNPADGKLSSLVHMCYTGLAGVVHSLAEKIYLQSFSLKYVWLG